MYPMFVSVAVAGFVAELLVLYSPPITTTRPSGSTADAKYVGWYAHGAQVVPATLLVSDAAGMSGIVTGSSHFPFW